MSLQNRVTPLGELIATPERGLVYGNRGCLHDQHGSVRRMYSTRRWIACRLEFKDRRRRPLMAPGRYTELFFLDEVTALAAGHRPCAECRREDYDRFKELWSSIHREPRAPSQRAVPDADSIDVVLHAERLTPERRRRLHSGDFAEMPDGVFVLHDRRPCLRSGNRLLAWSPGGYVESGPAPAGGPATVITPPSLVEVLRRGWDPVVPLVHPSALA